MLNEFDNDNTLSWLVRAGAQLASDLLDDDLAIKSPQYRRLLADQALDRLNGLPDASMMDLGLLLIRLASEDKLIQQKVENQIPLLRTTGGGASINARIVLNCYATYRKKFRNKTVTFLDKYGRAPKTEDYGLSAMLEGPQMVENAFLERGPKLATYLTERLPKLASEDRTTIMHLFAALP